MVLFLISFYILDEAYRRFQAPPEVAVAAVGLVVNLVGIWVLRRSAKEISLQESESCVRQRSLD